MTLPISSLSNHSGVTSIGRAGRPGRLSGAGTGSEPWAVIHSFAGVSTFPVSSRVTRARPTSAPGAISPVRTFGPARSMLTRISRPTSSATVWTLSIRAILAISRAIGETAPLVVLGIPLFLIQTPTSIFDSFTALPMQIYNWTGRPQAEFQDIAAAGIIVLLALLILLNSIAVLIRNKFSKKF